MFPKLMLLLFSLTFATTISAQNVTLIDIDANLEVVLLDRLDPGAKKTQNRYFENRIAQQSFELFREQAKQLHSLSLILDKTVNLHIELDKQGYPNPLIVKSAIKKLNKNDIQLAPYIQLTANIRIEGDAIGQNDMLLRIQPNIEFIIKIFDNAGKVSAKSTTTSVYEDFIVADEFSESGFNKSSEEHIDLLLKKIDPLLLKGIRRATKKLKI